MTSSMGCGIWGGNITNENIALKHYMNVTWVSRPIPEDRPSDEELFGEFYNSRDVLILPGTHAMASPTRTERSRDAGTARRPGIAAYLLVEYLERLGVDVIFGLCGHTIIALLDALRKSSIRFITTRHEQVAAHAADGYARASGKVGVLLTHLGPGLTNAVTGVANAALDSIPMVVIAGDVPSHYFGRHAHQEVQPPPGRRPVPDLPARSASASTVWTASADLPRVIERAFHLSQAGRPGPVLVDVPMDIFSADLPVDAFDKVPAEIAPPRDRRRNGGTHRAGARITPERPVLYAGGGVLSARAFDELAALAEALEVPVAHTLMGNGCIRSDHPLLLGMTGFWGTPIANETCRAADLIRGSRARASPRRIRARGTRDITFTIPPTRLMHIDIDLAEIGRNYQTELGVVADAKLALASLARTAAGRSHRDRGTLCRDILAARQAFEANWAGERASDQYPLRPERILADLRAAVPGDGFIVTDVGWNKNGVGQQFPFPVPGTFITPSGLATMGFGAAAVLGVKHAHPDRAVVALVGDGGFGAANPTVVATAMEAGPSGDLGHHGQRGVRHDRGPRAAALRHDVRLHLRARGPAVPRGLRGDGARVRRAGRHDRGGRCARAGAAGRARIRPADRHPGADGERADADAGSLEHPGHLPEGFLLARARLCPRNAGCGAGEVREDGCLLWSLVIRWPDFLGSAGGLDA